MCELCDNKYLYVGGVFELHIRGYGICEECGADHLMKPLKAEYRGLHGNYHVFTYLKSFRCHNCGLRVHVGRVPCNSDEDNALVVELFGEIPVRVL